jgi:hypothetical protein
LSSVSPRPSRVAVVVAEIAQRVAVALPISLENHAIRRFGAFHETARVEIAIGREQLAEAGFGGGFVDEARSVGRCGSSRLRSVIFVEPDRRGGGALARQHRLLLMPRALAEHRVEPHAEEGGNHGEQDDGKSGHGQKSNAGNGNIVGVT